MHVNYLTQAILLHSPLPSPHIAGYQLKEALCFLLLLAKIFLPSFDLILLKKPCLRFCTLRDGLNVSRFPAREVEVEKGRAGGVIAFVRDEKGAGWVEGAVRDRWEKDERREDGAVATVVALPVVNWRTGEERSR